MVRKLLLVLLILILVTASVLTACKTSTTTSTSVPTTPTQPLITTSKPPATSTQANWWDKLGIPKYGGTINLRQPAGYRESFDPYNGIGLPFLLMFETMFVYDWKVDRATWPFKTSFVPEQFNTGCLAESWEQSGPQTMTVHLRKGVHWQNKAPVNGRELTAQDVEANFDRELGTGHGFTTLNAWWSFFAPYFKKVTALDSYTLKYEFNAPSSLNLIMAMQQTGFNTIVPPEVFPTPGAPPPASTGAPAPPPPPGPGPPGGVVVSGPLSDWKNAIGTGPWMLTDYISQNALTFSRNPDYWGYDERYPKNKLPYADTLKAVVIPDNATALAALRTGKLDVMTGLSWQQASALSSSNPELEQITMPSAGYSLVFRNDLPPFTDIRVKKALNMAVDRQAIAKSHYNGVVDGAPCGLINPAIIGYTLPFKDWPADLKSEYTYNPGGAKQLLKDAGFPNGFKTNVIVPNSNDVALLEIIKAQFMDVGVDMEIKAMDFAQWFNMGLAGKQDGMTCSSDELGNVNPPWTDLQLNSSRQPNFTFVKDPVFDGLLDKIFASTDSAEVARLCTEADIYDLKQHWAVRICPTGTFIVKQPYLKGYSGEVVANGYYARFWIDK